MWSGIGSDLRLKSLRIRNFRSIGDEPVEIELGKRITILIGLNNSGKSNLIRALELATYGMNVGHVIPDGNLPIQLQNSILEETKSQLDIIMDDVDLELLIESILDSVISEFYRPAPGVNITDRIPKEKMKSFLQRFVEEVKGNQFALRRIINKFQNQEEISQANLITDLEEEEAQRAWMNARMNLSMSNHPPHHRFLQLISESLSIESSSLPIGIPIEYPASFIALRQMREAPLTLENYRSKIYLLQKDNIDAFRTLEEIITSAFPNYESIVPEHNDEDNTTVVFLNSGNKRWEIGIQGDGIKRMILFFLFLVSENGTLLLVDEPEMHLHPNLENRIIDFFQQYGKGQLVMATHSEIIVNSIPPELIDSGDVVINWLWLDENNQTKCRRSSKSDIVEYLKNLGVPTNRYLLHMYAHSSKRVFVEGKNDSRYIKMILDRFNLSDELGKNDISFIEYEGKYNLHKIDSFLIDASLKAGGSEIETPPVSCLFIRDKDESVVKLKEADNLMILSVREIENTVMSESSIRGVVSDIISSFEIDDIDFEIFEDEFVAIVKNYLNRWTLLKLRNSVESVIRPLLKRKPIEQYDQITDELAKIEVNEFRNHTEEALKDLEVQHKKTEFQHIHSQLSESCFSNGGLNYQFICSELPGKNLIHLIKDTLVQIISSNSDISHSKDYVQSKVADICRFEYFLRHTTELPKDIEEFVKRIKKL